MPKPDLTEFHRLALKVGAKPKPPCQVALARQVLSDEDAAALDVALLTSGDEIPTGAIVKWFEKRSHDVSQAAITSHRYGKCRCSKADDDDD